MHRVRQSLPYFKEFGWLAEVITVDSEFIESYSIDNLLLETIPSNTIIHKVKAFSIKFTRKFGLGSLSIRSFLQIKSKGNELLKNRHFDLIYFSTTAFHVMALGPYWKRKFKVPFILDIQDPWRNDFYLNKPVSQRPPKFWFSYNLDKYLEKITIPNVDGIISVSKDYNEVFQQRYPGLNSVVFKVIPFAGSEIDFKIVENHNIVSEQIKFNPDQINVVYIGRGGHDMEFALSIFFSALAHGLEANPLLFKKIHCWFIGTSYAAQGFGKKTIQPVAETFGVENHVSEISDRLPYFETLALLQKADFLFVPGSTDKAYTASKIYPYILAKKPILGIFHQNSSVVEIINATNSGSVVSFEENDELEILTAKVYDTLSNILTKIPFVPDTNWEAFKPYTAREMTLKQCDFFDSVLNGNNSFQ